MTREEFEANVAAYGAQLHRWPEQRHQAALTVAGEPWAQQMLAEAAGLDLLLSGPGQVDPARVGRAIGGVTGRIAARPAWRITWQQWLAPVTGFITAGVLGVVVGVAITPQPQPELVAVGQLFAAAMSYSDSALLQGLGG
ncbi:hypothetical protein [Devosia sp. FKR38]|uniref:hypothetical protein n=1 Tax=Devosia sp. FKR38 TaxID=2562312 RepID=UPI0014856C5E|nr:hypothetical protein [Devosia sp. FKR38]